MSQSALRTLLISSSAVLPMLAASALAAPHRTPVKTTKSYSASLQAATGERAVRTLDWRTPSVDLRFDLSQADVIRDLSVTISADPLPGVDPSLPLLVQFNNGKPTRIRTKGQGFDATVKLERSRIRATGNVLRLSHDVPCDTKQGGYAVSLDQSRIDLRARPKSRRLQLREVESRLSGSAFAPETVGLVARGPLATRLQSLGAQAVGLRMETLPDFRTTTSGTDFDLVMVTRDNLYRYTDEADILAGEGPRIEISRDHPNRLFLTGDTDAEVLQTVQAFATNHLPRSRRSTTSPGEVRVQSPLDYARTRVDGTVRLDTLSVTNGALREYTFDVSDPAATEGDLVLRLTRDAQTAPGARLKAVLNGESLGEATLDVRRKTVSYPIRPGQLRGSGNRLELTTKAAKTDQSCNTDPAFIAIGAGSKLRLAAERPSAPTDLSRLAADGSVFGMADGSNTQVVLPDGAADYNAALGVVAKLAVAKGRGWTKADFVRGDATETDRHILSIEPFSQIEAALREPAPRALESAWRGQPTGGDNRLAGIERFASLDAEEAVRLASRRLRASGKVSAGGVAAIYPGPSGQLIGIISNTPGIGFGSAVRPLAADAHWNGLSGGVSRWNGGAIVMAQAALPAPGIAPAPTAKDQGPGLLARLDRLDFSGFSLPDIGLPEIDTAALSAKADELKSLVTAFFDRPPAETPVPTATFETPAYDAPAAMETVASVPTAELVIVEPVTSAPTTMRKDAVVAPAKTLARPALRGQIDLSEARHDATAGTRGFKRWLTGSLTEKKRGLKSLIRRAEVKASRIRSDLRTQTGLRKPKMSGLRVGSYEITPAVLLLLIGFVLAALGLVFASSTSRHGANY